MDIRLGYGTGTGDLLSWRWRWSQLWKPLAAERTAEGLQRKQREEGPGFVGPATTIRQQGGGKVDRRRLLSRQGDGLEGSPDSKRLGKSRGCERWSGCLWEVQKENVG